jgi:fermentation-respiration switch protein FrsA (DUF1100 family)
MQNLLYTVLAMYITLVGLMYILQRKMMYMPAKDIQQVEQYGLFGFGEHFVKTSDGVNIQLWYKPAAAGFPTIIYFHGNAGHIGDRAILLGALADKGFGVLATSYRGYGKSEGSPTEQGLYNDARASIDFLVSKQQVPISQIMLFGESLGTGIATQMATEYPVGALMLQAPYMSVAGRAAEIYYYIPVRLLIADKFDSIDKIDKVKCPLLIFHGELDDIIPIAHGKALFAKATCQKRSYFLPSVRHNDFDSGVISAHVLDFAKEHSLVH